MPELNPCPFCGAGETQFRENGKVWQGMKYSDPVSVSVQHWCAKVDGQPQQFIDIRGRNRESAIAEWNRRSDKSAIESAVKAAVLAEREACADVCEEAFDKWDESDTWSCGVLECARLIRARRDDDL